MKTLSYSEVVVTPEIIQMGHFRGSPCTMGQIHPIAVERVDCRICCLLGISATQLVEVMPPAMELDAVHQDRSSARTLRRALRKLVGWWKRLVPVGVLASLFLLSASGGLHRLSRHQVPQLDVVYGRESRDSGGRIRGRVET